MFRFIRNITYKLFVLFFFLEHIYCEFNMLLIMVFVLIYYIIYSQHTYKYLQTILFIRFFIQNNI